MTQDRKLTFANDEDILLVEPEPEPDPIAPEDRLLIELLVEPEDVLLVEAPVEPEPEAHAPASAPPALMQILPADFPLPTLLKFVPDVRLRAAADAAAEAALAVTVTGNDGLGQADARLTDLRAALKAIEEHFEEPASLLHKAHKSVTSTRGLWMMQPSAAADTVGRRIWTEQQRLKAVADDARRKEQEEANRKFREEAQREADAQRAAGAPNQVVAEMLENALTKQAPPVPRTSAKTTPLAGNAPVTKHCVRITGTPADQEPNPDIEQLTPAQRLKAFETMRAILEGKAPIATFQYNWKYLNKRVAADKETFAIPGLEMFKDGGVRGRRKS